MSLNWILQNFYSMHRNKCWLTCCNQTCDIRSICFGSPACWINDDRQIAAKLWYIFLILPNFYSKTTEPIFTNLLYDVEALVLLLMCALYGDMAFLFEKLEHRAKVENVAKQSMVELSTLAVRIGHISYIRISLCYFCFRWKTVSLVQASMQHLMHHVMVSLQTI